MIPVKEFKLQPGGLWTAVIPCNQTNPRHRDLLERILLTTIQHEAKVHGAPFDADGFRNVMHAMLAGDVEVLFLAAAWDLTNPKIVGATINFRSLFLQRTGQGITEDDGIYSEDVCMVPEMLRRLVAEKPEGMRFPKGGLGAHFIRECMQYFAENGMKGGIKPAGQRFEFLPGNTNIIKIQEGLGAVLGSDFRNSGLLRFDGITDNIRNKWDVPVELLNVRSPDGKIDPHNFLLRWNGQDERQKIHAGFTRGVRTFVGQSITQGQIVSSGMLAEQPVVECALASILKVADSEIQERKWGRVDYWSPHISPMSGSLIGNVWDTFGDMQTANEDEAKATTLSEAEKGFGVKPPLMHIHALREPEIVEGLETLGLEKRILGHEPSQTGALNLVEACESRYPVRPLDLVTSEAANDPLFSLDAA
jgi:hypothetical protein